MGIWLDGSDGWCGLIWGLSEPLSSTDLSEALELRDKDPHAGFNNAVEAIMPRSEICPRKGRKKAVPSLVLCRKQKTPVSF